MALVGTFRDAPCPHWFTPVAEAVSQSTVEEAVNSLELWRQMVEQGMAAHSDDREALSWYLWHVSFSCCHLEHDAVTSMFLAYSCSSILGTHRQCASLAYGVALQAVQAATGKDSSAGAHMRTEMVASLRAILQLFPEHFAEWLSTAHWSFDGAEFDLDDLIRIPFVDLTPRVNVKLLGQLRAKWQRTEDESEKQALAVAASKLAALHWKRLRPELLALWREEVAQVGSWNADSISHMLSLFPLASRDKDWFDCAVARLLACLHAPYESQEIIEAWCHCVSCFTGTSVEAGRALVAAVANAPQQKASIRGLVLDRAWGITKPSDTGLRLALIWHEQALWPSLSHNDDTEVRRRQRRVEQYIYSHPRGNVLRWLVDRLAELRDSLGTLGTSDIAALRSELVERLASNRALRRAASEFLLWCADGPVVDHAEQVVLSVMTSPQDQAHLQWLQRHPARSVQIRARAVLLLLQGSGGMPADDAVRSLARTAVQLNNPRGVVVQPRTWINNTRVEQALFGAVAAAEREFCRTYPTQWANDEERLVAWLLKDIEHELASVQRTLQAMALHGLGEPIHIGLRFREVPKFEEGQIMSPTAAHDVDIAFILRVVEQGFVTTTRASLVQAKKLGKPRPDGDWNPSFNIDAGQRDRLIDLTDAAFYLFLVPGFGHEECWVAPARFVRSLMDENNVHTALPLLSAARASRSLAHWLTYEVIGLWTGDERDEVVKRAEGDHPGRRPRFLVEVTVTRDVGFSDRRR